MKRSQHIGLKGEKMRLNLDGCGCGTKKGGKPKDSKK